MKLVAVLVSFVFFGTSARAAERCAVTLKVQEEPMVVISNTSHKDSSGAYFDHCLTAFKNLAPRYVAEVMGTPVPVQLELAVENEKLAKLLKSIAALPAVETLETKVVFSNNGRASIKTQRTTSLPTQHVSKN